MSVLAESKRDNGTSSKHNSEIAGTSVRDIKNVLKDLYLSRDDWRDLTAYDIRRKVEIELKLEKGDLSGDQFDTLIEDVVDEYKEDKEELKDSSDYKEKLAMRKASEQKKKKDEDEAAKK